MIRRIRRMFSLTRQRGSDFHSRYLGAGRDRVAGLTLSFLRRSSEKEGQLSKGFEEDRIMVSSMMPYNLKI